MTVEIRLEVPGQAPREYLFDRSEFVVGCHPFNEVVVEGLASRHGRFSLADGQLTYEDLGSRQGSRRRRTQELRSLRACGCELQPGDELLLGPEVQITVLSFKSALVVPAPMPIDVAEETTPDALLESLPDALRAFVVNEVGALLATHDVPTASTRLQRLIERLIPEASVSLVIPQEEEAFLDRVVLCWDCTQHHTLQSPASALLRERQRQHGLLVRSGGDGVDALAPICGTVSQDQGVELLAYLQVQLPVHPDRATLVQLANLVRFLQPALSMLLRLDESERKRGRLLEENRYFRARSRHHYLFKAMVRASDAMKRLHRNIDDQLSNEAPILILGEAGSGKQLIARALHHLGPRAEGMFITQNCGALSPVALDLELFGRGNDPETGTQARKGLLEIATGGTLFLDEVDRLPLALQAKLVRMFNEREIRRSGEHAGRGIDVRVVSATHRDIHELVARGEFRRDLFSLLRRSTLMVPPLRERKEDILPLTEHFLKVFNRRYGLHVEGLDEPARAHLLACSWPGNVRELQVVMETAVMKTRRGLIGLNQLDLHPEDVA